MKRYCMAKIPAKIKLRFCCVFFFCSKYTLMGAGNDSAMSHSFPHKYKKDVKSGAAVPSYNVSTNRGHARQKKLTKYF